jgi:PGF-pre-PGF domain-containing protein
MNNTRYYYNITACNSYGNCSTGGVYNFTTSKTTTPSRGGGGGGGGGGGVPLPRVDATQTWFNLRNGQSVLFRVSKQNISITNITFLTRQALLQLTLSLTALNDTIVPPAPLGVFVYQVDKVESGIADTVGTEFMVSFRIGKAWLDEHRIAEVSLYRLEGDAWHAYQPTHANDDVEYAYYTATVPGLSLFLIGGKPAAPPLQPTNKTSNETLNTSAVGTPSAALNETRPETASNETSSVAPERSGLSFSSWMLILFSVVVVVGALVLIIRHERRIAAGDLDHHLVLLREFVKKSVENGHAAGEIEQALVQHGWQRKYIDWAFKECGIAPSELVKEAPGKEEAPVESLP